MSKTQLTRHLHGLGSANYWYNVEDETPGGVEGFAWFIVQIDCIGYLAGWAQAWIGDQGPGYSNSQEAQWKRIGQGAVGAVGASSMGKIRLK